MSAPSTARAWLDGLPGQERDALASRYARALIEQGLTVYKADSDTTVAIPPVLSPEALPDALKLRLSHDAHLLLRATIKVVRAVAREGGELERRLTHGLTPLELDATTPERERFDQVATARVDYFLDSDGAPRALELNATIPAMQGYGDIIAHTWARTVGAARGLSAERIAAAIAAIGANASELLASVVAHHQARGGKARSPAILIVCRRGDAQIGELRYYERTWSAAGHRTLVAFVDEVEAAPGGKVRARGEDFDLVYRHIFARRVEPTSAFARLLTAPERAIIINPVMSQLEVKGMLALLSTGGHHAALDDEERDMVQRIVPWTRLVLAGAGLTPDGDKVDDLPAWLAAHPDRLVLKRSWDYGGKSVVLGPDAALPATIARMQELSGASTWAAFVHQAAAQPDLWVAQRFVPPTPRSHLLIADGHADWRELYVDISAYTNVGEAPRPTGGVCRASGSRIVNILGGGGLTPLIPRSVVDLLCA
jgi:hypothetical protein